MRVVGSGGFGITYEAEDTGLGAVVAIKEYYPFDFGDRDAGMSVVPEVRTPQGDVRLGPRQLPARGAHAGALRPSEHRARHARVRGQLDRLHGDALRAWAEPRGLARRLSGARPRRRSWTGSRRRCSMRCRLIHAADFLHGDIAPDNVLIRADGTPVLLDFGSARRAVAEMSRSRHRHRQGRLLAARAVLLRRPPAGALVRHLRARRHALSRRRRTSARGSHAAPERRPHGADGAGRRSQLPARISSMPSTGR